MIPYFQWHTIYIGVVPVQVWGLMVALGIACGLLLSVWAAKRRGLDAQIVADAAFWVIIAALLGGRLVYVLSEIDRYVGAPADIVKLWEGGMSISGGFIGALVAAWLYFRYKKIDFWSYADVMIFGLPLGLFIGRLGCFFIFDHPGKPTRFFLGQEYIDGIVRHNHGLYLSLNGLLLTVLFLLLWRRLQHATSGWFVVLFLCIYGSVRFVLDFFRATDLAYSDSRFIGLTVAQWLSIVMVAAGIAAWYYVVHTRKEHKS